MKCPGGVSLNTDKCNLKFKLLVARPMKASRVCKSTFRLQSIILWISSLKQTFSQIDFFWQVISPVALCSAYSAKCGFTEINISTRKTSHLHLRLNRWNKKKVPQMTAHRSSNHVRVLYIIGRYVLTQHLVSVAWDLSQKKSTHHQSWETFIEYNVVLMFLLKGWSNADVALSHN